MNTVLPKSLRSWKQWLNLADNADAKLETFTEILEGTSVTGWLGYNRLFESNLRMTRMD